MSDPTASPDLKTKIIQGTAVPSLGFGTWELRGSECQRCVETALEVGYRHIDTARMYQNEAEVGRGIAVAGLPREDLFVTSKIWFDDLSAEGVARETAKTLELLGLDYVDLYLIHWPTSEMDLSETIPALMAQKEKGLIKHVGVSNFTAAQMHEAMQYGQIFCNQVEYHVYLSQHVLSELCRKQDILLTAWSPLAKGRLADDPALQAIAAKHGKSPAQVGLRWLIEQDHVATFPRSSNAQRIRDNFDIWDFALDDEDRARIAALPKDGRMGHPDWVTWEWDD